VQYEAFVPTIRDRVVQMALKLVLEPIFETDFYPASYVDRAARGKGKTSETGSSAAT
jgi:retron-type reverse transcriptase